MKTLLCFCLTLGLWSGTLQAQFVQYAWTTIAGSVGNPGSADGTNSGARFSYPSCIALDGVGNLYVADTFNHIIRKLAPVGTNWVVTTIAGLAGAADSVDGTNSNARFNRPNGVVVDASGNVFVADHYNHTVRVIEPSGTNWVVRTLAGLPQVTGSSDGTNNEARFWSPTGIAVDSLGTLSVVDTANFTIRGVTSAGTNWVVTTLAGTALDYGFLDGTNGEAQFDYPFCITQNKDANLYVTDFGNHAIREIKHLGTDWVVGTIAGLSGAMGSADGAGPQATFNFPNGIAVDSAGTLFVADQNNHTIRRIVRGATHWDVTTIGGKALQLGSTDAAGTAARFNKPWGVAVDKVGILYVVDYLNHTIRKGTPFAPVPALQIARLSNQVVVSWPAWASNYALETSSKVSPGASWSPLTNAITISGGNFVLTNGVGLASTFYRLRLQ